MHRRSAPGEISTAEVPPGDKPTASRLTSLEQRDLEDTVQPLVLSASRPATVAGTDTLPPPVAIRAPAALARHSKEMPLKCAPLLAT